MGYKPYSLIPFTEIIAELKRRDPTWENGRNRSGLEDPPLVQNCTDQLLAEHLVHHIENIVDRPFTEVTRQHANELSQERYRLKMEGKLYED